MLWCTFFQDVVFADQPGYGGDPLLAALFAGITWGGALALLYMRGSSSGGTDFLTMSIKVLRPHLSVGVVTGAIAVSYTHLDVYKRQLPGRAQPAECPQAGGGRRSH